MEVRQLKNMLYLGMKAKAYLVIGQIGGRRYIVATPNSEQEALDLALRSNQVERLRVRRSGQTMTRYFVYSLVQGDIP